MSLSPKLNYKTQKMAPKDSGQLFNQHNSNRDDQQSRYLSRNRNFEAATETTKDTGGLKSVSAKTLTGLQSIFNAGRSFLSKTPNAQA